MSLCMYVRLIKVNAKSFPHIGSGCLFLDGVSVATISISVAQRNNAEKGDSLAMERSTATTHIPYDQCQAGGPTMFDARCSALNCLGAYCRTYVVELVTCNGAPLHMHRTVDCTYMIYIYVVEFVCVVCVPRCVRAHFAFVPFPYTPPKPSIDPIHVQCGTGESAAAAS